MSDLDVIDFLIDNLAIKRKRLEKMRDPNIENVLLEKNIKNLEKIVNVFIKQRFVAKHPNEAIIL